MKMKTADCITGVIIMILSVLGYIYSSNLRGDAGTLPALVFTALFLGALILFLSSFFKNADGVQLEKVRWGRWFTAVSGVILYIALLKVLGFYIISALYLMTTMFCFGVRSKRNLIMVPLIFDAVIFVCFSWILNIRLPAPFFM